ncbi:MAG TPA: NPCBM/NEW2 domain-containing protein [Candidatus Sulfopaludibacter sp.]|nr:NPCBM/NEW2 domain-containing protein [Candidatus Sulfopaludibacter sp.]
MAASILVLLVPLRSARGLTNGLALTPPMGWNSWNHFGCSVDESIVKSEADAMATNGMKAAGYQYINLDDCWQTNRDANGVIVADPVRFPDGIKALADYIHSRGLKLGIYSDHGTATCQGKPGSYGYEYLDALTYASWGVDYLKYDNCNVPPNDNTNVDDARMAGALMASGRPIVFSLCDWTFVSYMPDDGNLWRTTGDIADTFSSFAANLAGDSPMAYFAAPGRWNDPDMLEVGNGGMTATQDQSQFSMWCMLSAPLIAGNDLTSMPASTLADLTNAEAIAVDQDAAGEQGIQVAGTALRQVWCKPLGTDFNTKAVALFNLTSAATSMTVNWTNLGMMAGPATVRDLWAHADLGVFTNGFTTNVPGDGVVLLKVVGTGPVLPVLGTNDLDDLQPAYAYTGSGTMVAGKSIGGNTITLNGVTYTNGIGVNAYSGVEYRLGAVASRFQSDIGVDDEVGSNGSVVFQVYADGLKIYDSGVMRGGAPHQTIDLDVTGVNRLTLGVNDADDGIANDHADWAGVRVIVSNSTPVAPGPPVGLTTSAGHPVGLMWAVVPGAAAYNIYRSTSGNGMFTNIISTVLPNCLDSNVSDGLTYYYMVSSVGKGGESGTSAVASATACSAPAAPTGLTATLSGTQAILDWNPAPDAASYTVVRATSGAPYAPVAAGLETTDYTDTNRLGGANYYYAVASSNGCGQSGYSPYVFASTNVTVGIRQSGSNVVLIWPEGTLQSANTVAGPYSDVTNRVTLYTNVISQPQQFYRVHIP